MTRIICLFCLTLVASCTGTDIVNGVTTGLGVQPVTTERYASGPRGTYDIYRPSGTERDPVVVYFYGGSWQEGEKGIYEFLGQSLAKKGYVTVVPDYRLSPDVSFPTFVRDGAKAVEKIAQGIGRDRPIVLMGHSAGAHIAALLNYDPRYLRAANVASCSTIAGFIGLAGPYDFLPIRKPDIKRVFPPKTRPASQPINFASGQNPPSLLLHGAEDTTVHAEDSVLMGDALRRNGSIATTKIYPGVDHIDIVGAMAPAFGALAPTRGNVLTWLGEIVPKSNYCSGR